MASSSAKPNLLRIRASVVGSEPLIWRQLEVDAGLRLDEFHRVLQVAFDWHDTHLHAFVDEDPWQPRRAGQRVDHEPRRWEAEFQFDDGFGNDALPEDEWTLERVFDGFDGPLYYEYDFGDGWLHEIELIERISDPGAVRATLLRGERRGPLEDSGGIAGYHEKLEALADPSHPEHDDVVAWVDWVNGPWRDFDPEIVDVDYINTEFGELFDSGRGGYGVPAQSAIGALLERMPPAARSELRGLLRRTGALEPATVDAETAQAMVEPFSWLLRRAGTDGIRLTQAGWLPPGIVSDAARELGLSWFGKANREQNTLPVLQLREAAVRFGLLRKYRGTLLATKRGALLREDPQALWHFLANALVGKARHDIEHDIAVLVAVDVATALYDRGGTSVGYDRERVAFGLEMVGWAMDDGSALEDAIVRPVYDVLNLLHMLGVLGPIDWFRVGDASEEQLPASGRAFARAMLLTGVE